MREELFQQALTRVAGMLGELADEPRYEAIFRALYQEAIAIVPDEDATVLVRPDGGLSYPLVGNIQAAGKSVGELQVLVTERLSKYMPDPVVTVSIQQLRGNKIYVVGRVQRPGEFEANRYMDVVQALSLAGGMTPYAAGNKIKVLRRENGELTAIPFRYGDIEKGENLGQNIILQSGDVVLVP